MFDRGGKQPPEVDAEQMKDLHAKIGELAVANDFLSRKLKPWGVQVRRGMIEAGHPDLSIGKQCALLSISRSSFYYRPKGETALNLALMRRIDEQFLETPFLRGPPDDLASAQRRPSGEREAHPPTDAADGPDADLPEAQHQQGSQGAQDLPLSAARDCVWRRPNQVWAADITYLPMRRGFLYLVAIMDLAHPQGSGLAHLEHAGSRLLRRGVGRSHRTGSDRPRS